mgnify:CR=1 FL=1
MKGLIKSVLVMSALVITGCGDAKVINGVKYDTYGLLDEGEKKNPDIEYRIIVGNVVWSLILAETIYEPVGVKDPNKIIGSIR